MKTLKYLNKRIFVCLCLALIFLIVASFVASSAEDQQECDKKDIRFRQNQTGMVTTGTAINFSWDITKEPSTCFEGMPYYLEIKDNNNKRRYYNTFKIPSGSCNIFSNTTSWVVPEAEPNGSHISYLTIPGFGGSHLDFEVVETLLVIQKYNDTNQNNKVDVGVDERLQGWEFQVTDPDKNTSTHFTDDVNKEKRIKVLDKYAGKEFTVKEILQPGWRAVLSINQTVTVPKGETTTVQFLNIPIPLTYLIIQKFNDTNRNNRIDGNDERLQGWEFKVTDPEGKTTKYTTDNNGEIKVEVPPGNYIIEEILKGGWRAITSKKQTKKVVEGKRTLFEFLNTPRPPTWLLIQKFNDTNQNGKVDDRVDERLRGWEFNVTDPGGKTTTHFTNDIGEKRIKIPIGYEGKDYTIEEILKEGWKAITPTKQIKKVIEGKTTLFEFLNTKTGNLTIIKFYDPNQNGVQDPGEQGLAWNFSIMFPDGGIKRIRTDENGSYLLPKIPVGEYEITEEPRGCRWTSSTDMTQKVEVKGGQESIAQFRNYIAECCILPGCVWKNNDENIEVCKSVDPCSVALGKEEEEVTVHLGICVDPKHIINGTKVENISVIDTLHSQFTIVDGSFSEEPNARRRNPDGTTTITWDIPSLCCEEWNVSFKVTVAFALPIDVTDTSERITSKVIYEDPIETGRGELSIPEGTLKFIVTPPIWCYVLGVLLVLSISIEITLELKRRKKEKSKEK